ncbi:MAG TPA: protein kinase [Steroidobacteraceae bacterium]|nr:protein kinase [Steroidobacteraceae bacterium]
MTAPATQSPASGLATPVPRAQRARFLVVHDELELRLKLADIVRECWAQATVDTCTRASARGTSVERNEPYQAMLAVIDFATTSADHANPLDVLQKLREQAGGIPLVIIASGGDERWAVRSMREGIADYWPLHALNAAELGAALRGAVQAQTARRERRSSIAADSILEVPGYRLVKRIAQSTRAIVYLAHSDELPQPIALKLQPIRFGESVSTGDRDRFLRECQLLSKLNNRAVADVYDYGVTERCFYLAMEYFPCGSLRERLRNPLTQEESFNYTLQLAVALKVLHKTGVFHRDLKPSNLMLTEDNRLVLIDFGLARSSLLRIDVTSPNERVGTPYYMSPEQIDGQEPDERCDLYSLGVILYEMLAGAVPYAGHTVREILDQHRTAAVPLLPERASRYQPLINRLLAKAPGDRFASADQLIDAMKELTQSAPAA